MMSVSRVITALDFAKAADALAFAETIDPKLSRVKVGKELFTRAGPQVVTELHSLGCLLYTSPSPRDKRQSRMPSSA